MIDIAVFGFRYLVIMFTLGVFAFVSSCYLLVLLVIVLCVVFVCH